MNKNKYLKASIFLLLTMLLSSCYQYDPIEAKERLIEEQKRKNKRPNNPDKPEPNKPNQPEDPEDPNNQGQGTEKPNNNNGGTTQEEDYAIMHFDFELWKNVPRKAYQVPLVNSKENPATSYWVSASNFGYDFGGAYDKDYPTQVLRKGYKGQGVYLKTKEKQNNLVAASIYTGYVETKWFIIYKNPTRFGQDWKGNEPIKISFSYKYQAGKGRKFGSFQGDDYGQAVALLYDVTNDQKYLDKYSIINDKRIVLKAEKKITSTKDWTEETLDFKVANEKAYQQLDFSKRKYRIVLSFSASARGDEGIGQVGSTLYLDELSVYSKKN